MKAEDRIKIAEFCGYTSQPNEPNGEPVWLSPDGEDPNYLYELPDPENSADDDYLVLEAMRDIKDNLSYFSELCETGDRLKWDYQKGDYARALLRIENE